MDIIESSFPEKNDMNNPLISVIIPAYNAEKYIDQCVDSVLSQSWNTLELILVDDGSSDKTYEKCNRWALEDNRIRVFHKDNAGVSAARNYGLEQAHGDFLFFLDADDLLTENALSALYAALIDGFADFSVGRIQRFFPDGRVEENVYKPDVNTLSSKVFINKMIDWGMQYSWGKLYRRKLLLENGEPILFNVNLIQSEDIEWLTRIIAKSETVVIIDEIVYCYRRGIDESATGFLHKSIDRGRFESAISAYQAALNTAKHSSFGIIQAFLFRIAFFSLLAMELTAEGENDKDGYYYQEYSLQFRRIFPQLLTTIRSRRDLRKLARYIKRFLAAQNRYNRRKKENEGTNS